ncbi:hypothetical protein CVT24_004699 [Panaeolus cyanescens]|uniref:F-box domain-containing protein n=1 Tax=Panaeolus cyanescens TaxID=181874 RepID=A0A409YST0_9AGAR|nr:hypothetical protein CVT24_004699 [Panaeolus cyanescens]
MSLAMDKSFDCPYELIAAIFDHVPQDDLPTISACSQTSTFFRKDMQKRLFGHITLHYMLLKPIPVGLQSSLRYWLLDSVEVDRPRRLLSALTAYPYLASYVKSLRVASYYGFFDSAYKARPYTITQLLPLLSNLTAFTFDAASESLIISRYTWICPCIQRAIECVLLRNEHLDCVKIYGARNVPPKILALRPDLKMLDIISVSELRTSLDLVNPPRVIRPQRLRLQRCDSGVSMELLNLVNLLKDRLLTFSRLELLHLESQSTVSLTSQLIDATCPETLLSLIVTAPEKVGTRYKRNTWAYISGPRSDTHVPSFTLSKFHKLTELGIIGHYPPKF